MEIGKSPYRDMGVGAMLTGDIFDSCTVPEMKVSLQSS
jgi:hypothetical protein